MSFSPVPRFLADKLTDITPAFLHRQGISLLMMDFDNTIIPYVTNTPTPEMVRWLREMQKSDIRLCVVSNSKRDRVPTFCREYGLAYIVRARKPFPGGIRRCLARYGVAPEQAALVGDQIYTDALGANCAGVTSIVVKAICNQNFWLKARHALELPFIFIAKNRRITHEKS